METIASNACLEVALGEGKMRRHFRDCSDERHRRSRRMCLAEGNVFCAEAISDRDCGMCKGAKCVAARRSLEHLRRDDLVGAELRPPVHDAMADRQPGC